MLIYTLTEEREKGGTWGKGNYIYKGEGAYCVPGMVIGSVEQVHSYAYREGRRGRSNLSFPE